MQQHYAPPDEAEKMNLDNLIELLREIDDVGTGGNSLAAEVTRTWATFLDDTWTWEGILNIHIFRITSDMDPQ
jgi:hypothetical protein